MKRIQVSSAARAEIDRVEAWYERQKEGLGDRFLSAVEETADRIALNPEGYAKVIKEARKADLRKFPYSLWFTIENDVVVIACLHQRRHRVLARERALGILKMIGYWRNAEGKQVSQVLGLASEMKGAAREAVAEIVKRPKRENNTKLFGPFVEGPYFEFYSGKWKASTAENNKQRIRTHLVEPFREREMASLKRDEFQALLDAKSKTHSFSVVDHLRWDAKQIFDMAIAGIVRLNPAALIYTPKEAPRPIHRALTVGEVTRVLTALDQRERLIARLAILGGMRPGEIFGLTRAKVMDASAEITQRVYRNKIDTPKTHQSVRKAALTEGVLSDLEEWGALTGRKPSAYVFASEVGTPLSKDNVWRRNMKPKLAKGGLGWVTFQVFRRTHSTLMRQMKADPHAVAAQLGHGVDVSLNTNAQSPVESRVALVNDLERLIAGEPERCVDAVQKAQEKQPSPK